MGQDTSPPGGTGPGRAEVGGKAGVDSGYQCPVGLPAGNRGFRPGRWPGLGAGFPGIRPSRLASWQAALVGYIADPVGSLPTDHDDGEMTEAEDKDAKPSADAAPETPVAATSVAPEGSSVEDDAAAADAAEAGGELAEPEPAEDPLELAEAECARWKDRCLRTAADFDNFRKRSRRDVEDAYRRGREELFRDLLPVFDNLERAVAHVEGATEVASLAEGIRMVMRLFADTLSKLEIERVQAVGVGFDPSVHEAIQHLPTDEHPPGTVAAEVQPGYRMGNRLVRPAMVVVAKANTSSGSSVEGDSGRSAPSKDAE